MEAMNIYRSTHRHHSQENTAESSRKHAPAQHRFNPEQLFKSHNWLLIVKTPIRVEIEISKGLIVSFLEVYCLDSIAAYH